MSPARVTLRDVAEASGVSPSTASFVLNRTSTQTISVATRERVEAAARSLGYVPNAIARALREGTSRLVVLDVESSFEGNYSRSYVRGLDTELTAHDHVLLVRHRRPGAATDPTSGHVLAATSPRAVLRFGERYVTGHELDDGGWDDGMAANTALQVTHLIDRGHSQLAFVAPEPLVSHPLAAVRWRFILQAARSRGLPEPYLLELPSQQLHDAEALAGFHRAHPQISAVCTFDDLTALRLLSAARRCALDVPGQLAVVGFDATEYAALSTPTLSTVHIDAEAHGRRTARAILGLPADEAKTSGVLVHRGSS